MGGKLTGRRARYSFIASSGARRHFCCASIAHAADAPSQINGADVSWLLTSSALVLMMTIPGLALFYGGLVRRKNVLSTLMQSFILAGVISIEWVLVRIQPRFRARQLLFRWTRMARAFWRQRLRAVRRVFRRRCRIRPT